MKTYHIQFKALALSGTTQFQVVRAFGYAQTTDHDVLLRGPQGNTVAFLHYRSGIIRITEIFV